MPPPAPQVHHRPTPFGSNAKLLIAILVAFTLGIVARWSVPMLILSSPTTSEGMKFGSSAAGSDGVLSRGAQLKQMKTLDAHLKRQEKRVLGGEEATSKKKNVKVNTEASRAANGKLIGNRSNEVDAARKRNDQQVEERQPSSNDDINKEKEQAQWDPTQKLVWKRRDLYLPISDKAKEGFLANNEKQKGRMASDSAIAQLWKSFNISACLDEVPECEFWQEIGAKVIFRKCCVEHMKMKKSLFYALDVAEHFGLKLFLDSGTLLSAMRDGGDTLVPWETDIDIGIVGVVPTLVSSPFADYAQIANKAKMKAKKREDGEEQETVSNGHRRYGDSQFMNEPHKHLFSTCLTKVSKNVSRNGMCRDAHYVYYATSESEAKLDTSRVEIWPFWPDGAQLIHPTRKKLTVNRSLVEPLTFGGRCKMWGRPCWCPADSEGYLDHEYTPDWRVPKTIHWGQNNIQSWKPLPPGITPNPPKVSGKKKKDS